jgi:hypothetical protein
VNRVRTFLLITFGLFAWVRINVAGTLTLEWDPSPDPEVVGYQLYYGAASQQYTNVLPVGVTTRATVSNLTEGVTYYFAATTLDVAGLESDFSGEAAYLVPTGPCLIILSNLVQVYDGTPKGVSAFTTPADFGFTLTYAGAPDPPIDAGIYPVTALSTDPRCVTSTMEILTIKKASLTLQIGNLDRIYDGTPKPVFANSWPVDVPIATTYNGQPDPPSAAGLYLVTSTVVGANNYEGIATAFLSIAKGTATVLASGLSHDFDGTPKPVSIITIPSGLNVEVTYDGLTDPPSEPGVYAVLATVDDPNFQGSLVSSLQILAGDGARAPTRPVARAVPGAPTSRPIPSKQPVLLSWPTSSNAVTLWQSTDLATWTPITNLIDLNNSTVIGQGPPWLFF